MLGNVLTFRKFYLKILFLIAKYAYNCALINQDILRVFFKNHNVINIVLDY